MITILGRETSLNARKVLWALDELGLPYAREDWGMPLRNPKVPEFLRLNPNGSVPVLVEGDFVLWESNAILIYLAEREGKLLPADVQQRALVHQWLSWQVSELNPSWSYAVMALIRKAPGYDDPKLIAASFERWASTIAILDAHLAASPSGYVGPSFSVADIALGLSVHRWLTIERGTKTHFAALADYHARLLARPAAVKRLGSDNP